MTVRAIVLRFMCSSEPSRAYSFAFACGSVGTLSGWSVTAKPDRLSTSTRPFRSRILPRGACTVISRTRLLLASAR